MSRRIQAFLACVLFLAQDVERLRAQAGSPAMSISRSDSNSVRLSWPDTGQHLFLESARRMGDCVDWTRWPETPTVAGNALSVTVSTTDSAQFFHLYSLPESNLPPALCRIGDQTVTIGERLTLDLRAIDPNRQPLSFSALSMPTNANLHAASGQFVFQPTLDQLGTNQVTFQVSDGSLSDSESISIDVQSIALQVNTLTNGQLRLSWPSHPRGFVLEQADGLEDDPAWLLVTQASQLIGDQHVVLLPPSGTQSFFRLHLLRVPPLFVPIAGSLNVALGSELTFDLFATDLDNDQLLFSAATLPLPAGARLNGGTGQFSWRPGENQVGTNTIMFVVNDGYFTETQAVSIVVQAPPSDAVTRISGRILDTTDAVEGADRPVVGARVSLLGVERSVLSGADGRFVLSDIPAGKQVLDIATANASLAPDGSPYAAFREEIHLVTNANNVISRPFYLPRIDLSSLTIVNPNAVTTVRNTNLNIIMTIPAHSAKMNGQDYSGPITISLVPSALAPAALPDFLQPDFLITIQPVGVTYAEQAQITFPNTARFTQGNRINLWSLDAGTGQFTVVGIGEADGDSLRTTAGGIRANDWHAALPPVTSCTNQLQCAAQGECSTCPLTRETGSSTFLASGTLTTEFGLPSYVSMNQQRGLRFAYNSLRAYPYHLIPYTDMIPRLSAVPDRIEGRLMLEGVDGPSSFFTGTDLREDEDELLSGVMPALMSWIPTGSYQYTIRVCHSWPGVADSSLGICSGTRGHLNFINGIRDRQFGVGWGIPGIQRLHVLPDQSMMLSTGDGAAVRYEARGTKPFTVGTWSRGRKFGGFDFPSVVLDPEMGCVKAHSALTNNYPRSVIKRFERLTAESVQGVDVLFLPDTTSIRAGTIPLDDAELLVLRRFIEAGGAAILLPGADPSLSLLRLFAGRTASDPHSLSGLGDQRIPVSNPLFSPVTSGRHGRVFDISKNMDQFLFDFDLSLKPLSFRVVERFNSGVDLAVIPSDGLTNGSGPIIVLTDFTAFADYKQTADERFYEPSNLFDRNEALFLNIIDYCIARIPEPAAPDQFISPRGDFTRITRNPDGTFTRAYQDGSQIHFNSRGLQTFALDRHGNASQFDYDAQDHLERIIDPVGLTTVLIYQGSMLSEVIDPTGRRTTFAYDFDGNLTQVAFPDNTTRGYGYDDRHLLLTETNELGYVSSHQFDYYGRMTGAVRPDGSRQVIVPEHQDVIVEPSAAVGTANNPAPAVRKAALVSVISEGAGKDASQVSVYRTGLHGEATSITIIVPGGGANDNNLRTDILRDQLGQATAIRPPSGHIIENEFDSRARLIETHDPLFRATYSIRYEPNFSQVAAVTDGLGNTATNAYDDRGNLTRSVSPMGRSASASYNSRGQPTAVTNALGLVSTLEYDDRGNLVRIALGDGEDVRAVTNHYTKEGYRQSVTDPLGQTTRFKYNTVGQATNQILANGTVVHMTYNAAGQASSITPPERPAHTFEYTPTGLLAEYAAPDLGDGKNKTRYEYNPAQQLTRVSRPDGLNVDYSYDFAGRLTAITNSRGATTLDYDAKTGLLAMHTSPDGITLSYRYQGELVTNIVWSGMVAGSLSRSYDPNYRVRTTRVNDGPVITYDYDKDGLVTKAGDLHIARAPLSGLEMGTTNGLVTTHTLYDLFGQVTNYFAMTNGEPILVVNYERDRLGRITQKHEVTLGETNEFTYRYDAVGRLTNTVSSWNSKPAASITYRYDANGNRTQLEGPEGIVAAIYDAQDRLVSRVGPGLVEFYTYTQNGDLKSKAVNGKTTTYRYDEHGNLIHVDLANGDQIHYVVDGNNRRTAKLLNGRKVQSFLYNDQLQVIAELNESGETISQFVYHTTNNVPSYAITGGVTYGIIGDHLGTPRFIVDCTTGAVIREAVRDEWGHRIQGPDRTVHPFGFGGGIFDPDTELTRFGKRDYCSASGNWTSKDGLLFAGGSANLYTYAGNDPVNLTDPSGEILFVAVPLWIATGAIIGAVGAAIAAGVAAANGCQTFQHPAAIVAAVFAGAAIGAVAGYVGGLFRPIPPPPPTWAGPYISRLPGRITTTGPGSGF